ncbi:hypothetical protein F5X68DRAFT_218283 [Plectosphaerella plurivora]|uniref:Uncharacterized protein n=1 Tax=Plectosphaerella plurivora TaxID=936078 RepID=A0A9P9A4W4_9PEZI|nr:hypothetical protein F5X68DRAFT_218283 [Plectosphaerella plurivora]
MQGRPLWETSQRTFLARHERHALGARFLVLVWAFVFDPEAGGADVSSGGEAIVSEGGGDIGKVGVQDWPVTGRRDKQEYGSRRETKIIQERWVGEWMRRWRKVGDGEV